MSFWKYFTRKAKDSIGRAFFTGGTGLKKEPQSLGALDVYVERDRFSKHYGLAKTFALLAEEAMPSYRGSPFRFSSIGRDTFIMVAGLLTPRVVLDGSFGEANLMQDLHDAGVLVVAGSRLSAVDMPRHIEAVFTPQDYKHYRGVLEFRDSLYLSDVLTAIRKEGTGIFEQNKNSLIFIKPPYETGLRDVQVIPVAYDPNAKEFQVKPDGGHTVTIKAPMNPLG